MRHVNIRILILTNALVFCMIHGMQMYAQKTQGIGTSTPDPRAVLELSVENPTGYPQGFLPPRLTTLQRMDIGFMVALGTVAGMTVFDTSQKKYYYWDGSTWKEIAEAAALIQYWTISGSNLRPVNDGLGIEIPTFTGAFRVAGSDALRMNNDRNIFLANAGNLTTTGLDNVFIGTLAGRNNTVGSGNNFFGMDAGRNNTTGHYNNFFGNQAGRSNNSGANNNFFGFNAGYSNGLGANNNFFGSHAGLSNTSGQFNNFFGGSAGNENATGSHNNFFGNDAGKGNTLGSDNIAIGRYTGFLSGNLVNAVAIGALASVSGSNQVVIGQNITGLGINVIPTAMLDVNGGARIRALSVAGSLLTVDGLGNVGMGNIPIISNDWTVVGSNIRPINNAYSIEVPSVAGALKIASQTVAKVNSNGSLYLGDQSGNGTSAGLYNLILGYQAGQNISTGSENIIMGYRSGNGNLTGFYNSFIGRNSGYSNTIGQYNQFFGYQSGYLNLSGSYNLFVGRQSGYNNVAGSYNIMLGDASGYNTTSDDNVFIGRNSGFDNSTGRGNIFLGSVSGFGNTTGSDNIGIGKRTTFLSSNLNNAIAIGSLTSVAGSNQIVMGQNITGLGINVIPTAMLDVNGGVRIRALSVTGSVLTVDGDGNIGMGVVLASPWINAGSNIYFNAGSVGIGTSSPSALLDVKNPTTVAAQIEGTGGFTALNVLHNGSGRSGSFINSGSGVGLYASSSGNYAIETMGSMFVQGAATITGQTQFSNYTNGVLSVNGSGLLSVANISPSQWQNTGTGIFFESGNVGIGLTSPSENLQVNGTFRAGTLGTDFVLVDNAGNFSVNGAATTSYFENRLGIGVGAAIPQASLHVDGNTVITGPVTLSGLAGSPSNYLSVKPSGEIVTVPGSGTNHWQDYSASAISYYGAVGVGNVIPGLPLNSGGIDFAVIKTVDGLSASFISINNTNSATVEIIRGRSSTGLFNPVLNGDELGSFRLAGAYNTSDVYPGAYISAEATQNFDVSNRGTRVIFANTLQNTNTNSIRMTFESNGAVGIGSSNSFTGNEALRISSYGGTKGMVIPYITTAQMAVLTASLNMADEGMLFWNTDSKDVVLWDGSKWDGKQDDGPNEGNGQFFWNAGGNTITGFSFVTATGYGKIGTNENYPVALVVNNQPHILIDQFSSISIGKNNVLSSGAFSSIAIGSNNLINGANRSIILGNNLTSDHLGAVMLGDWNGATIASTTLNQLTMRFIGGYRLYAQDSNLSQGLFIVGTNTGIHAPSPSVGLQVNAELGLGDATSDGNKPIVVWLKNNSGFTILDASIVAASLVDDNAIVTTSTEQDNSVIGVTIGECPNSSTCKVAIAGVVNVRVLGLAVRGQHCVSSTVSSEALSVAVPNPGASIGVFITNKVGATAKVLLR